MFNSRAIISAVCFAIVIASIVLSIYGLVQFKKYYDNDVRRDMLISMRIEGNEEDGYVVYHNGEVDYYD